MKKSKKVLFSICFIVVLLLLTSQAAFAKGVAYYEFSFDKVGCPWPPCNTTTYSNTFDMTDYVTVNGWQDTYTSADASVKYQVVIKGFSLMMSKVKLL